MHSMLRRIYLLSYCYIALIELLFNFTITIINYIKPIFRLLVHHRQKQKRLGPKRRLIYVIQLAMHITPHSKLTVLLHCTDRVII